MDILNANNLGFKPPHQFNYKRYTDAELMAAMGDILSKQPQPKVPVMYMSEAGAKAFQHAIMGSWDIVFRDPTPCPNCHKDTFDGHCSHCDYPYNK